MEEKMNCQDINQNIYDYCDGELSPDMQLLFEQHIAECKSCYNNYQLTLIENEALRDTEDIPSLSPAFTSQIMSSLTAINKVHNKPKPLVLIKSTASHLNRISYFSGLAVIAAIIALCIYMPNLSGIGNKVNIADNYGSTNQQQSIANDNNNQLGGNTPSTSSANSTEPLNQEKTDSSLSAGSNIPQKPAAKSSVSEAKSVPLVEDSTMQSKTLSVPVPAETAKRSAFQVSGRARIDSLTYDSANLSFSPQNVPERFTLINLDNEGGKQAVYNYSTQDGKETLQLKVVPYSDKMTAIGPISNTTPTPPDSLPSVTRDVQIGNQKITVTFSGNLSIEDLNQLADIIQFKEEVN